MTTRPMDPLAKYIDKISLVRSGWDESERTVNIWFRGQPDSVWGLVPGLYRSNIPHSLEREMIRDFKLRARTYVEYDPANDLEWMFAMQHYGTPTRLLDWTESSLYALFFAVADKRFYNKDGCVWILDPWSLNADSIGLKSVPTAASSSFDNYVIQSDDNFTMREVVAKTPAAVRPTRATPRIIAQSGCFTIHGCQSTGIERLAANQPRHEIKLRSIRITSRAKPVIFKALYNCGVTASSLFPGLEGIAREISYRYSAEFMNAEESNIESGDDTTRSFIIQPEQHSVPLRRRS